MDDLKIEYMSLSDIKPYRRNAKKHPAEQVEQIANSITQFGMNDPIAVAGDDNEIVEGHGRYLACKQIHLDTVPVIRLDHLTDEQRKAYNLVHNKLTMNSDFDLKLLSQELDDIFSLDMNEFGFEVDDIHDEWEDKHQENRERERFSDANILNLERAQYPGVGDYDIPQLHPVTVLPQIDEWIGFNYVLSEKNPENKAVHFFLNDYQFERIWNNPNQYIDKLSKFAAVATPDFSPYCDMPFCLQLYNHYRKHWVGAWMQEHGITVIPTIRASTDHRSFGFYLDGEPHGGAVLISSMWTKTDEQKKTFLEEFNTMYDTLNPSNIFLYGKQIDGLRGNITKIKTFTETRFKK